MFFLTADTKSIVQTHTFCTTLVNKNRRNRTFYNSVGRWITGVKRNFWLYAICACTEQHSTYQIRWENWWFGLRIWCLAKCVWLGLMLQLERVSPIFFTGFCTNALWHPHPQTNKHCNVRALSHKTKCGCSVPRIRKNINNLTASKQANITLLDFLHLLRNKCIFFLNTAWNVGMFIEPDESWLLTLVLDGRLYRALHPKL